MNKWTLAAILLMAGALTVSADVAAPARTMDEDVKEAIELFKKSDTKMDKLFETSHGYAVYPNVAKGGCLFGAGAGQGQVFERGRLIGTSKLSQLTFGAQLGGQKCAEVIFFETKDALDEFRKSDWTMAAGVSAVAAAEGA